MRRLATLVACAVGALAAAVPAAAEEYAPLERPGPELTAPARLQCTPGVDHATRAPVLLNPGTGVTVEQNFAWNWERALSARGIPWCAYDAPQHTLGDIQASGELLADAIRTVHARAGRRIAILGHSQGGMSMRWALRFWPDTRAMVDDVIGFAGSNHGTRRLRRADCARLGCAPAVIQQAADSDFVRALNSRAETFAGVSYTNVYTHTDEVVQPATGPAPTSALRTGGGAIANVATQDVCPLALYEHALVGTVDPVAFGVGIDALDHDGPAVTARVPRSVCAQTYQPGVDPLRVQTYLEPLGALVGLLSVPVPGVVLVPGVERVRSEPALRCYALAAGCPAGAPRRCASRRRVLLRLPRGTRRATVTLDGRRVKVRRRTGRLVATIDLRGRPAGRVLVRIRGTRAGGRRVRQVRRYRVCATERSAR